MPTLPTYSPPVESQTVVPTDTRLLTPRCCNFLGPGHRNTTRQRRDVNNGDLKL